MSTPTGWFASIVPKRFRTAERVLVLKLDLLLLSYAFVCGLFKDMDQSATTAAYVSGLKEDLKLYGNELVQFTTYFSIGYALSCTTDPDKGTLPRCGSVDTQIRPSLFLPIAEVIWGTVTLATYAAPNAKTIYGLRFLLGMFESTSWPGLVALLFNWYTPSELGKRLAIFGVSGVAGNMFLGILQAALYTNLNGAAGLAGWQWLFVISGLMTIFWGFLGLLIIPDSPANTRALWLTEEERALAASRMQSAGTKTATMIGRRSLWKKIKLTAKSPVSWLFLVAYLQFAWSQRANSYFLLWLKGLKDGDGGSLYTVQKVNLIPLGGYSLSIVANIGLNAISDWKLWRLQISTLAATVQLIACAVLSAWPNSVSTIMAFYFITFTTAAWGYALLAWLAEILRQEPEARSLLVGLAVTLVYVGHATIPLRAWRVADSPRYPIGFPLATAFAAGGIISLFAIYLYVRKNPSIITHGLAKDTETTEESVADDLGNVEDEKKDLEEGRPVVGKL